MRLEILRAIAGRLVPGAQCLIVSQYRNPEFVAMGARPGSQAYQDGWLMRFRRGAAFYAPLDANRIERMGRTVGLVPCERYLSDGTALCVMARAK